MYRFRHSMSACVMSFVVQMLFSPLMAQRHDDEETSRAVDIAEVEVRARRQLSDIGVSRDDIDTSLLRSSVSLSMADVLMSATGVYVKHSGRASLSTVAIRGAGASHTQVTWNGLKINSPMMGQVDFSSIPAYFVGEAKVLYGTSSLGKVSGGLGGAVTLHTPMRHTEGVHVDYVQGIGSWCTLDEYLSVAYGSHKWSSRIQLLLSTSDNDFSYINRDRKENLYDDNKNIIAQYYPKERNVNGKYRDMHVMGNVVYNMVSAPMKVGLCCWYTNQDRERPMLSSSYIKGMRFENRHREQTLRAVARADYSTETAHIEASVGFQRMQTSYDYSRDPGNGEMVALVKSRNNEQTAMCKVDISYMGVDNLALRMVCEHDIQSVDNKDRDVVMADGSKTVIGYNERRAETSAVADIMWRPLPALGLRLTMREELCDGRLQPLLPAFMAEWTACESRERTLRVRGSVSRNYRRPSLNDLYYMPGGNVDLKAEQGRTADVALTYTDVSPLWGSLRMELACFDSDVDNWIMWLPTAKGFFSPRNVKRVHAYGAELKLHLSRSIFREWHCNIDGNYTLTKSINNGEKLSPADKSQGKQLPFIPIHTGNINATLTWRSWQLAYSWNGYSERFTMSSNAVTYTGQLKAYGIENVSLQKRFPLTHGEVKVKLTANNIFNKEYQSILSRPMPGRNYECLVIIKL